MRGARISAARDVAFVVIDHAGFGSAPRQLLRPSPLSGSAPLISAHCFKRWMRTCSGARRGVTVAMLLSILFNDVFLFFFFFFFFFFIIIFLLLRAVPCATPTSRPRIESISHTPERQSNVSPRRRVRLLLLLLLPSRVETSASIETASVEVACFASASSSSIASRVAAAAEPRPRR